MQKKNDTNKPESRTSEYIKEIKTVSEEDIFICQCCGKEIKKYSIFCDEHNTPLNRQIYEFFTELPVKPRGTTLYEIFTWYLAARFGYADKRRAILKSATGVGKCLKRDTMISTNQGLIPIQEVVVGDKVNCINNDLNDLSTSEVTQIYNFYDEKVINIKTKLGYSLGGTPEHKIVVLNENGNLQWKKLIEITNTDYLLISKEHLHPKEYYRIDYKIIAKKGQTNFRPLNIDFINEEIGEFLGYYVAEGSNTPNHAIQLTNGQEEIADRIQYITENVFKLHCSKKWKELNNSYALIISSQALSNFLISIGVGNTSHFKSVPDCIFKSPESVKCAFLKAYFDGDGYVSQNGIGCGSVSEKLISDIQLLLLSLGIISSKKYKPIKYNDSITDSWHLRIISDSLLDFKSKIGEFYSSSRFSFDSFLVKKRNTNLIVIPNIHSKIREIYLNFKKLIRENEDYRPLDVIFKSRNISGPVIRHYMIDRNPHRLQLLRILEAMEESNENSTYKYLIKLCSDKYFFDQIDSIEEDISDVFDITVKDTHNYLGNGFVSHNSFLMDMIAYIELTHFPNSFTVIGSISERVSKLHIERLRYWLSLGIFDRYITGTKDATASKTEVKLAKLNSKVISLPQSESTITGWHPCFPPNTEVLTPSGWMSVKLIVENYYKDVSKNYELLAYSKETNSLQWEPIIACGNYFHKGNLIHFKNKHRKIDILVTPMHRMIWKHDSSRPWQVSIAEDFLKKKSLIIPASGNPVSNGIITDSFKLYDRIKKTTREYNIELFLKFLGYFISEGWLHNSQIQISQAEFSPYFENIKNTLNELWDETIGYDLKRRTFSKGDVVLSEWLEENCGNTSYKKHIPKFIFKLNPALINIFLNAYFEGDSEKKRIRATTKSKQLADDIQALMVLIGYNSSVYKNNRNSWLVAKINGTGNIHILETPTLEPYNDMVYAIQVPSTFLLCRYNNKVFITGNSLLLLDEIGRMRESAYLRSFYQMGRTTNVMEFSACFDDSTELLTTNGFINVKNIKKNDVVATFNLETNDLEYQNIKNKFVYPYNGDMIFIKGHNIDQMVTNNHKLVIRKRNTSNKTKRSEYNELMNASLVKNMPYTYISIPRITNPIEGKNEDFMNFPAYSWINNGRTYRLEERNISMDLWLKFLGYYLSEGWIERNTRVGIAQKYYKEEMFSVCREIAGKFSRKGNEGSKQFRIQNPQLTNLLPNPKAIPSYVFNLSIRQRLIFLNALHLGDGDKRARKDGRYTISLNGLKEQKLIEDLQYLFITLGIATKIVRRSASKVEVYGNKLKYTSFDRRNKMFSNQNYSGLIYGFEVPNHTLLIRRNGIVSVSGNSTPFGESRAMYGIWESPDVKRYSISMEECWWISPIVIEQAKRDLPPNEFTQLFLGEFGRVTNKVIPDDILLEAMERGEHLPTSKNLIMGIDFGETIDPTGIVILDMETGDIKYTLTLKEDIRIQLPKIKQLYRQFKPFRIIADNSHKGSSIIKLGLPDLPIEGVSMHNEKLKGVIVDRLKLGFYNNKINIADTREFAELVAQLKSYVYLDAEHKSYGPLSGHDDLVDALALAMRGMDVSTLEDSYADSWKITRAGRTNFYSNSDNNDSPWAVSVI